MFVGINRHRKRARGEIMLPTMEEAEKELQMAGELNPGPWVKHSLNLALQIEILQEKYQN